MARQFFWLLHKDLVSEYRGRRSWPAMLLLGVVVALVFGLQMELLPEQKRQMLGGLLWISVTLAGMQAVDRAFGSEREEGCWAGLKLLPAAPATIFAAKLAVNFLALLALESLLVPLFFTLGNVPLSGHAAAMLALALLASLGLAAVGTLVGALTAGGGRSGSLLALVVFPLVLPVVLAAAESTRLIVEGGDAEALCRWLQLLGAFAVIFVTAGVLLCGFAMED